MNGHYSKCDFFNYKRKDLAKYGNASNLQLNEKIKEMKKRGEKVYHMSFGQSPFPLPEEMVEALKRHAHQLDYLSMYGIIELRQAICNLHRQFPTSIPTEYLNPDNIVVTDGSKMALYLLMALTDSVVVLVAPAWVTYHSQVTLTGKKSIVIQTTYEDGWKLTPHSLAQAVERQAQPYENKLVIFTNPGNPSGQVYTAEELRELAEVFRKYKMIVVSDEIYSYSTYDDTDYVSLSKFYPEGTVITTGLSKWASGGGWRIGYAMFPPELSFLRNLLGSAASHTFTCAAAPQQYAVSEYFNNHEACAEYMKHCTRILHAVSLFCSRKLREAGLKVKDSNASYYMYPDFSNFRDKLAKRSIFTAEEMCAVMFTETKVALLAGGVTHLDSPESLTLQLCYVNFDGKAALAASRKIGLATKIGDEFVLKNCGETVEAIGEITKWCNKLQES